MKPNSKNQNTLPLLMALLLVGGAFVAGVAARPLPAAPDPENPPDVTNDDMRYTLDLALVRDEWRQTGAVTLPVPQLGNLVITGTQNNLTCDKGRCLDAPYVHILGSVMGYAPSKANLLIGDYGVYGQAEVKLPNYEEPMVFYFDAEETSNGTSQYQQWVHLSDDSPRPTDPDDLRDRGTYIDPPGVDTMASTSCKTPSPGSAPNSKAQVKSTSRTAASPPDPCDTSSPDCSGGYAISWITYHAERGFVTSHSNWRDRIVSAAAKYATMYSELCINLRTWVVETSTSVLTSSRCDGTNHVLIQYRSWLTNTYFKSRTAWNDDAYQLWTARDLEDQGAYWPDVGYCFGTAWSDTVNVGRTNFNGNAISVMEGKDYCCYDYYDPDETHERGIVSGHELAHVYGEENHPYKCNKNHWYSTAYDCNMMRNCKDPGKRLFFFVPESKQEIMFGYHYTQDASTSNDGKPDCP